MSIQEAKAKAQVPPRREAPARWLGLWDISPKPYVKTVYDGRTRRTADFFFVSYCRADEAKAQPFLESARKCEYAFWIDQRNLPAGSRWQGDIVAAIRASRGVIVFCSRAAFASNDVFRELTVAARCGKTILPLLLDDAPMPDEFMYYLSIHETVRLDAKDAQNLFLAGLNRLERGAH